MAATPTTTTARRTSGPGALRRRSCKPLKEFVDSRVSSLDTDCLLLSNQAKLFHLIQGSCHLRHVPNLCPFPTVPSTMVARSPLWMETGNVMAPGGRTFRGRHVVLWHLAAELMTFRSRPAPEELHFEPDLKWPFDRSKPLRKLAPTCALRWCGRRSH